ncbi:GNAT family N-acetyltransferase [Mesobacillus foraminis]|uniref:GNAT family N-acetyltransferase n=1 Tax=Mesobacillus foraminis TaxID=279826 RepID=UPI00399F0D86
MEFHITKDMKKEDREYIHHQLFNYNSSHFPEDLKGRFEEISLFLREEDGKVRGGLLGEIVWNWLEIHTLMVDEDIRKSGYGTKLLAEAEKIAIEKKCDFIKLDTLSFQALEFYEKNGYQVYGTLDHVGRHFKHYYLKKDL